MKALIVFLLSVAVCLFIFLAIVVGHAQDKPVAKTPTLTDTQRVTILQAEVSVLTKQVENLQAQLAAKDKEFAFKAALTELYKVGETTAKDAGADKTDFDLDLNSLTFKEREKPKVTSAAKP